MSLQECGRLPRGYGASWWDPLTGMIICYPFPFNLVAAFARRLWLRVRFANPVTSDPIFQAYLAGRAEAFREYQEFEMTIEKKIVNEVYASMERAFDAEMVRKRS